MKVGHTSKRKEELHRYLQEILSKGSLDSKAAERLRGRMVFFEGFSFGRVSNRAQRIVGRCAEKPGATTLSEELQWALKWLDSRVCESEPLSIDRNMIKTVLVFTDGACNPEEGTGGVGGVLVSASGRIHEFFGEAVPGSLMRTLLSFSENPIFELELIPLLICLKMWAPLLRGSQVVFYLDNDGARHSMIRTYGGSSFAEKVIETFLLLENALEVKTWFSRVPTASNIADNPSLRDLPAMFNKRSLAAEDVQEAAAQHVEDLQAAFPSQLSVPYQGQQARSTSTAPDPQRQVHDSASQPVAHCQAWTRAVKAKRGPGSADKRNEAFQKILSLLHAFATFFDLASLLEDDENEGDSLRAVLAPKAPSTILKHAGPVRMFCEWLVKSNTSPPFGEKVVWTFVHCVLKMPRTAASTLDTCLRAIKWSYHSLGLRVQLEVFRSARVSGLVAQALQNKSPWDPAPPLTVAEVLQLHSIAHDRKMSLIDRCGAAHFLAMIYGRARASDIRCVKPLIVDRCGSESWRHSFIELGTLHHKTSRFDAKRRRILPLVIPGIGIGQAPFGQLLLDIRNEAGLRNDAVDKPFLPAPLPNAEWSSDPLSSSEITRWLRFLLPRPSSEKQLSSHSLKVTTLVWCSRFGMTRETKRVLGHHADAASGSDAVYGRELQSAALREYILILEAIAAGQFRPDRTRSGHFAPGWSREAILKAAAAAPAATVQSTDIAEDEDEALAVVSDDSDSDADDTDMLICTAMTSPVDSAPYFIQRAEEISLGRQVLASAEFDSWSESILGDLTVGEKASL
ncbi:unnamed protein product, partial [Symbiodinium microadriaticum]